MTQLTTRFQIPTPDGGAANNYPQHMKQMADKIAGLITGWSTGTLAQRPGPSRNGWIYSVTGDTPQNNDAVYFDTGSKWVCLYQNWVDYETTAAQILCGDDPGYTGNLHIVGFNLHHARYKVLGDTCHISYDADIAFSGASDGRYLHMDLPVLPVDRASVYITAQGGARPVPTTCRIEDGFMKIWPAVGSSWQTDGLPRQLSFCGEFKVAF